MELHAFILSLLLLSIITITEPRSVETSYQCAATCTEPENFLFKEGKTYRYNYAATVTSTFHNGPAADQSSEISIQAHAMIDVLSHCELVLRITDASIQNNVYISNENQRTWIDSIQQNPLHFSFQDGRIPDICASNDDPTWVLNVKRGILSALQVSSIEAVEAIQETDVTGACESSYEVQNNNEYRQIVKHKDYKKCEDRDKHLLFSHFTPYNSESPRQNFIQSSQTCTQRIQEGLLQSSICDEEHLFRPFSSAESGARTIIRQTLVLSGMPSRYIPRPTLRLDNARRTNLIFEKEDGFATSSIDISELQSLKNDLCAKMSGHDYKQVGKDFIQMVFLLRRLDSPAIQQVYGSLEGACPQWETALKAMFQDALQWCGSEGCVVFATRLIESQPESLPDAVASRWLTGMSLITKPTVPMLRGMMDVVQSGRLKQQSYLTAGTMIHRLCTADTTNCLTEPVVRRALDVFEDELGVNCRTTNPDQKQMILLSLRALGNAGRSSAINTLAACAREVGNDMETRIAAVQTFRRMPCNSDKSGLSRILFDVQEDAEIRIASYLSVMKCPTASLVQQIVILLNDEPVKQVSSFIWSHVNQILESNDPLKGYIKPLLLEIEFAKKHDLDPRKYSRFYEASLFSASLNIGATVESSVVWSPKSFAPRSAELDLTVDVFGQAVNLFEIGGRVEGVEKLIQKALASDNFLKNNPLSNLFLSDEEDEEESEGENEEDTRRQSRETDGARSAELHNEYQANLNTEVQPNANWYLRVFGNEMHYQNTRGMRDLMASFDTASIFSQLATGGRYHYHDDTMLMNSAHVLPTGIGLPLTIAFNGSASIDINANGHLDIAGLFSYPRNLGVVGSLNPRAVIVVAGSMSVDAIATKTGIATESSAISSWTIGGRASIVDSQSVEVRIDAPYERNTVFSFNHKLIKLNGDEAVDIGREQANAGSSCSPGYAGQRFCVESPSNAVVFPVDGALAMSAYMEKTDDQFDHYIFEATYTSQYDGRSYPSQVQATLRLDTPGSTENRETNIRASYNLEEMDFAVNIRHPQTNIMLQGAIDSEPMRKNVIVTYVLNGAQTRLEGNLEKVLEGTETRWSATTSLETPSKNIRASANASVDPQTSLSAQLQIDNLFSEPIIVGGSLEDTSTANSNRLQYRGSGQFNVPGFANSGVRFDMNIRPRSDVFSFRLDYEFSGMPERSIYVSHKRRDQSTSTVTRWKAEQKLTMTQFPDFNHAIAFSYVNGPGQVNSFAKIDIGRHAGHEDNRKLILVNQTLTYDVSDSTQIDANLDIQVPPFDIAYSANLNHLLSASVIDSNLQVGSYGMHFYLRDNASENNLINKELRVKIPTPWGNLRLRDSIVETSSNIYTLNGELGVGSSKGLSMIGRCDIENLPYRKNITINLKGDSNSPLLSAHSVFAFVEPVGFSWENSLVSKYNNLVNLNLRHEGSKEGGFESSVLLEHQPDKYLKASLDFENDQQNLKRFARLDFNDASGTRRFIELSANKVKRESDGENLFNVSVSFTNNLPQVAVNSLVGSFEKTTSHSTSSAGATVVYNENEVVGFDGRYNYAVERDNSGLTTGSLNLRQGFYGILPNSATVAATIRNTVSDGHVIEATYSQDSVERLRTTFRVNNKMTTYEGDLVQMFNTEVYPENMGFVLQLLRNRINLEVTYTRQSEKTINLSISRNSPSSYTLFWSHNDRDLSAPRSIDTTLEWGTRARDNGKGIWLVSLIDRNQPLNAEVMYFATEDKSFRIKLQHQVRRLLTENIWVPQILHEVVFQGSLSSPELRWSHRQDNELKAELFLFWRTGEANIRFTHNSQHFRNAKIPMKIGTRVRWSSENQPMAEFSIDYDDTVTTGSLSTTADAILSARYFSNCSLLAGQFDAQLQRSAERLTINLSSTKGRQVRRASIGYSILRSQSIFTAHMRQNFYEDEFSPNIPSEISIRITYPWETGMSFSGHYNDYMIAYNGTWEQQEQTNKYIFTDVYSDNIWNITPDVRSRMEVEIHPYSSISILEEYTINQQPKRMFRASLSYDTDSESGSKKLTALFLQNNPYITEFGVPEESMVVLTGNLLQYGLRGAIEAKINNNLQAVNAIIHLNTNDNSFMLGIGHNFTVLPELRMFKNLTVEGQGMVSGNFKSISIKGFLQINDESYEMDASVSMLNRPKQAQVEIHTEIGHNVRKWYDLGIPLRIDANSNVGYGVASGGDLSGATTLTSTIFRTMLDAETGEKYRAENHVNASVDIQLFSKNLILTVSHDFDVESLPNTIKYELSASGSTPSSHVYFKSLSMSLTLDGKKQKASVTINYNPTDNSFILAATHNATQIYKYGVPGKMSISFRKRSLLDFDLAVIFDTSRKSVGLKFDYHGENNHLQAIFNHNFDMIVERIGIPKRIGVEVRVPYSNHDAEFEITYIWGQTIKNSHITITWDFSHEPTLTYNHHQNITTDDVFPRMVRGNFDVTYGYRGFNGRLTSGRKHISVTGDSEIFGRDAPYTANIIVRQNLDTEFPRASTFEASLSEDNTIRLSVALDRVEKLHTTITTVLNKEEKAGSISISNRQGFVAAGVFPTSVTFYLNGSIDMGISTYLRLVRDDHSPFIIHFKSGVNMETESGFVELTHTQKAWKKVLSKRIRADATYIADAQGNQRSLQINVRRGRARNEITLGNEFSITQNSVFGRVSCTHNFNEYNDKFPMSVLFSVFLEKTESSLSAQANVTLNELSLTHSVETVYNDEGSGIVLSFEILQHNVYLDPFNIPHTVSASISAEWEDEILATIRTQYGDKVTNLTFSTDKAARGELRFSHSWELSPHDVRILLTRLGESSSAKITAYVDGTEGLIDFTGNLEENQGEVHISHHFEDTFLPSDVILQVSYRMAPDYYFGVNVIRDGEERSLSLGYIPLENGFHITSTLLDDVSRTATFEQNLISGGFSLDVEHNVPELLSYLPGSFGVAASANVNPQPNITLSIRQQDHTRMFTTQADLHSLLFNIKHDFDFLPIPHSITFEISGSTNPYRGRVSMQLDGTERTISGTADPENMFVSLLHTIPELPLPDNLEISVSGSSSPLSGGVSVTINGLERKASASFDRNNMEGRLQHNIPEFDKWFSVRDLIVGVKGSIEPVSGEVYVSIDGLERRLNGVLDTQNRYLSIQQNLPELRSVPRNISLSIKGNMEPLSGSIHLTIDEVQRSINTELNTREPFVSLSHSIPEADPYIPRHLSLSVGFSGTSGHVSAEFEKDGKKQGATLGLTVNSNHIRVQFTHTLDSTYEIPNEMSIEVSGSIDHKNVTVYVGVDNSFVSLGIGVLLDSDGWYGGSMEFNHNLRSIKFFPSNFVAMVKGRKVDKSYEFSLTTNGFENFDYHGVLSLLPTIKAKRTSLYGTYEHVFNGHSRSLSGSVIGSKKRDLFKVIIDGTQTAPQRRQIHFMSSVRGTFEEQYEIILNNEMSHNILMLDMYGIPRSIENGQATLTIIKDQLQARGEATASVNGQSVSYSFDAQVSYSPNHFIVRRDVIADDMNRNEAFAGVFSVDRRPDSVMVSHTFTITNRENGEVSRDDDVVLTISLDPVNPSVRLQVSQPELNYYGFPLESQISFHQSEQDSLNTWELRGVFDDMFINLQSMYKMQMQPFQLYTAVSFNQSVPLLTMYRVPTHLLWEFAAKSDISIRNIVYKMTGEYNHFKVKSNGTVTRTQNDGKFEYEFVHNVPAWRDAMGFYKFDEMYAYSINEGMFELSAGVWMDDKGKIGSYHYTLNLNTYEMTYTGHYLHKNYVGEFSYGLAEDDYTFTVQLTCNGNNLFLFEFRSTDRSFISNLVNHAYGTQFDILYQGEIGEEGYNGRFSSVFSTEVGNFTTAIVFEPYTEDGLSGKRITFSHTESNKRLSSYLYAVRGQEFRTGKLMFSLTNKNMIQDFPKKTLMTSNYNPEEFHILYTSGRQRLGFDFTLSISEGHVLSEMTFSNDRISFLQSRGVPQEIRSSLSYTPSVGTGSVTADEVDVARFESDPSTFNLQIRNLEGEDIIEVSGTYATTARKSIDATIICSPWDVNMRFTGLLVMFEPGTGNSTLSLSLIDNINPQRIDMTGFACPTSVRAEDFLVRLNIDSTVLVLPFNIRLMYNSSWDENNSAYIGKFRATYDDVEYFFEGMSGSNNLSLKLMQPWFESVPVVSLSAWKAINSEGLLTMNVRLQWDTDEDSVEIQTKFKQIRSLFYSLHIRQPSNALGIHDYDGNFFFDFTESDTISFGTNSAINGINANGINVTYTGVLPQAFGSHNLKVVIKQTLFQQIPSQFTTTGLISITSTGIYHSDWRITSQQKELVVFKKSYMPSEHGMSCDLFWKQAVVQNVPFSYLRTRGLFEYTENGMTGRSSLQLDNIPEMSGAFALTNSGGSDRNNKSLSFRFVSGPFSPWLKFRTMSFSTWCKTEFDSRQAAPAFSVSLQIDEKTYRIESSSHNVSSRKTMRLDRTVSLTQPHDVVLFGLSLPRESESSWSILQRSKGSRIVFNYNNDRMEHPFKLTSHYRFNNEDVLFEVTTDVKYGSPSAGNDIMMRMNIARNGNDHVMTMSMQYPDRGINGEVVLSGVNSDTTLGFGVNAKDYSLEEVPEWEARLSLDKRSYRVELYLDTPNIQATTLRGDLTQVIAQGRRLIKQLAAEAATTRMRFVRGIEKTPDGYDMYIGYDIDGDTSYTLHMRIDTETTQSTVVVQTKKNFEIDAEVIRATVRLADERLVQFKLSANPTIVKFLQRVISNFNKEFSDKVNWLADNIVEFLESLKTVVVGDESIQASTNQKVDAAITKVNVLREFLRRLSLTSVTNSNNGLDQTASILENVVRDSLKFLLNKIDNAKTVMLQPFTDLRDEYYGDAIARVNLVLEQKLQPVVALLRKANAGELFIELVQESTQNAVEYAMAYGEACLIASRRPLSELLIVTATEVIFNIPLQFEIDHFAPLPTLNDVKKWVAQSALAIKIDDAVNTVYSYTDQYYRARALIYIPRGELLPPFKGRTFVSGFRHFSTFDKRHFSFTSGCATSHVLAADHRDGNFTVSVSYANPNNRRPVNSIEVIVGNRHVIVSSNYRVEINNRVKQLPVNLDLMSVVLEGNVIHVRRRDGDLDVACDFTKDLCTVDISPYYFGATAGLAGIYNNEPEDDFTTPSHEAASIPDELASAWMVSDTVCSGGNIYRPCASNSLSSDCSALFEEMSSPMRSCFPLVDPKDFMNICRDDMCNSNDMTKRCAAAHAYAYRCNLLGAAVSVPDECVVCSDARGNEFDATQSRNVNVTGVDVVFVIEQGSCMRQQNLYKSMRKFMKRFDSGFPDASMYTSRFHLVGYGGPGASAMPHTFTIKNSKFSNRKKDVVKAMRKIPLSTEQVHADALGAVYYATQLSFRAGAKPIIVLLTCDQCHSEEEVTYSSVEVQLRQRGIRFHHLAQQRILAGSSSKSMFGFDSTTAFSQRADTSSDVIKPIKSDLCVPLATGTGGSVWDATQLGRTDFVTKLTRYIINHANLGEQQSCICTMNDSGVPSSVCTA